MIALNIEVKIPKHSTTAKPFIGPEPKANNAIPAIRVVIFASNIVPNARSYPALIAACGEIPIRNSSRIRSFIRTLASIAMPIVSAIAAIPGSVKVACKIERRAISNNGVKIDDLIVENEKRIIYLADFENQGFIKISFGKKKHYLIKII